VAEQLHISQPALSKHIRNLEETLGVRLFDREVTPLGLTAAGEQFVRQAEELLYQQDRLKKTMEQFRSGEAGCLDIGVSPFRTQLLMPQMLKKLRLRYPGIRVCLHEPPSDQLRKEAAEGKFDFAIVNLPVDESVLDVTPMAKEKMVLAIPMAMLDKLPAVPEGDLPEIDLKDCGELPFVAAKQGQEMRRYFDKLFTRAGIHPNIAVEVTGLTSAWALANAGLGAALVPMSFIADETAETVKLFSVGDSVSFRQPVIVKRRGYPVSEAAQYAIDLLVSG
jgi:DNA-binding transcriptional LysR family regulator